MEMLLPLIMQLAGGALGGNVLGSLAKNLSSGPVGNSIAGAIGGGLAGQLAPLLGLGAIATAGGGADLGIGTILTQLATGGAGGGIMAAIVGLLRSMMAK